MESADMRIFALLLAPLLSWSGSNWLEYEKAIEMAKSEGKMLLLMVEKEQCPYCDMMSKEVLPDPEVAKIIDSHYKISRMFINDSRLPTKATMSPTFLFVNPHTKKVYKKILGAWKKDDFKSFLELYAKDKK